MTIKLLIDKKVQKLKQILFAAVLGLTFMNPALALAQGSTGTANDTSTKGGISVTEYSGVQDSLTRFLCTPSESGTDSRALEKCINKMYRFGISFGAIALVFFVVFAGYLYMTGGETGKQKAKGIIQNALIGMGLLLGSYVILSFINPNLVIIKPIQPPIFDAAGLPSCEDIGFKDTCVIDSEDTAVTSSGKGGYMDCPDGIINFDKKAVPVNGGGDTEKVCKAFMEKLKQIHAKHKITVTSTIRNGAAESQCHYSGNSRSGVCADMSSQSGNWQELCTVIKQIGGLGFLNESGSSNSECGTYVVTKNRTGNHLHVYLSTGGGGTASRGGSRPYCIPNKEFSFLCDSPSGSPWTDDRVAGGKAGFTSSDPTIQANLTELKKRLAAAKVPERNINQSYRPHEYSSHMRSFWEATALISGKTDAEVSKKGFYCDGSIQFVKKADIDKLSKSQKDKIVKHAGVHDMQKWDEPTTCLSDHGFGYAVDVDGANPANMEKYGLCRNLQGPKWNQRLDVPHYVLKEKNRNTEGCK